MNWIKILREFSIFAIACTVVYYLAGCGGLPDSNPIAPVTDGNIAFARTVTGGSDVFFYGTPTEDGRNLTNLGTGWNQQPSISPDNTKIAFVSRRDGNREIYVMSVTGSNVVRLTNDAATDRSPAWSPDGTKIVFVSDRDGTSNIYTMSSSNGSNVTRITTNNRTDDSPSWSPDGQKIVFSSELGSSLAAPVPRLYTIKIDGTSQTLISNTVDEHEIEPSWSALNIITYTRSSDADGAQIYTMHPDGSQVRKLTSGAGGWHPCWSDGGDKIVFASDRTGTIRIYTMLASGTNIHQLINKAGMEFEPDWGTSLGGQ
jgi:Tol biopolymer transport system component